MPIPFILFMAGLDFNGPEHICYLCCSFTVWRLIVFLLDDGLTRRRTGAVTFMTFDLYPFVSFYDIIHLYMRGITHYIPDSMPAPSIP